MLEKTEPERNRNEDEPLEKPAASPEVCHDESQEKQAERKGLRESTVSDKELFYQLCNGGW